MTTALEHGERLYRKMVDAWLEAALLSFTIDGDKEARAEFRAAFGRNPKHIVKAVERFPQLFSPDGDPDLFDILAAIHLSKVKSDDDALALWERYVDEKDYNLLREMVKQHNAKPARAKRETLAERVCSIKVKYNKPYLPNMEKGEFPKGVMPLELAYMIDELNQLPEIAAEMKRREGKK